MEGHGLRVGKSVGGEVSWDTLFFSIFTVNLKFPENLNCKNFLLVLNTTQPEQLNSEDLPAFLYEATHLMKGKRASYR